jgi:hypothetical protein
MKKSLLIAACSFACIALDAYAQVGLGGGAVGALGTNGAASATGGLGSGIRTGATSRGAELRDTGQLGVETRAPGAAASTSAGTDANASGNVRTETNATGSASTPPVAPPIGGSVWGGGQK